MRELDHKAKHWRTDALELWCWKRLLNPLDVKEIKAVIPKGNQLWIFTGRTDAETPTFWPPDEKSRLIGKDPDAGKDWEQEKREGTDDEMVGWHHWLQEIDEDRGTWHSAICGSQRVKHDLETEQQQYKKTQVCGCGMGWQNVTGDPNRPAVYVWMIFTIYKELKTTIISDTWKRYAVQILLAISEVLLECSHIHWFTCCPCGCVHAGRQSSAAVMIMWSSKANLFPPCWLVANSLLAALFLICRQTWRNFGQREEYIDQWGHPKAWGPETKR